MPITIHQEPQTYSPVYNDIIWVCSSSNQPIEGVTDFKYIADIWYDGELQQRLLIPARPDGYLVFNAARIIESLISHDITEEDYGFFKNTNSFKQFYVKFGEEFGLDGGATSQHLNLATSSSIRAYNGALDPNVFIDYDDDDYLLETSSKLFLTNSPRELDIETGQSAWIHMIQKTANGVKKMQIKTYDTSGSLIDTFKATNNFAAASSDSFTSASSFYRFGTGPIQLNNIPGGDLSLGSQPIIGGTVASYTVQCLNNSDVASSELFTYNIVDSNCKYDTFRIHWLNKLGGFDSFNFTLVSRKNVDIQRKTYRKTTGELSGTSWSYSRKDRGMVTYDVKASDTQRITSDWITEEEAEWLEELFTSPEVFYEDEDYNLIAINITNASYEVKKKQNDKLINITVDFVFSYIKQLQRG